MALLANIRGLVLGIMNIVARRAANPLRMEAMQGLLRGDGMARGATRLHRIERAVNVVTIHTFGRLVQVVNGLKVLGHLGLVALIA